MTQKDFEKYVLNMVQGTYPHLAYPLVVGYIDGKIQRIPLDQRAKQDEMMLVKLVGQLRLQFDLLAFISEVIAVELNQKDAPKFKTTSLRELVASGHQPAETMAVNFFFGLKSYVYIAKVVKTEGMKPRLAEWESGGSLSGSISQPPPEWN